MHLCIISYHFKLTKRTRRRISAQQLHLWGRLQLFWKEDISVTLSNTKKIFSESSITMKRREKKKKSRTLKHSRMVGVVVDVSWVVAVVLSTTLRWQDKLWRRGSAFLTRREIFCGQLEREQFLCVHWLTRIKLMIKMLWHHNLGGEM